jgi:hypothetical protein
MFHIYIQKIIPQSRDRNNKHWNWTGKTGLNSDVLQIDLADRESRTSVLPKLGWTPTFAYADPVVF